MNIVVARITSDDDATVSTINVDQRFVCFGLEDEYRADKVAGETRIPAGQYSVSLRTHGGFHDRYSERFADIHRGMLEVADVPGFSDILIHVGNTDEDTSGCLLVGMGAYAMTDRGTWLGFKNKGDFKIVVVGKSNSDPYPEHEEAIRSLAKHFGLTLDRESCFPYRQ